MEYNWQIGDEFKFRPIKSRSKRDRCLDPNKTFLIHNISNQYNIYYFDTRTNKKCKCRNCNRPDYTSWNFSTGQHETTPGLKSTNEIEMVLVRTKNQRQREISLKLLNI
jgi:hypothetical protein